MSFSRKDYLNAFEHGEPKEVFEELQKENLPWTIRNLKGLVLDPKGTAQDLLWDSVYEVHQKIKEGVSLQFPKTYFTTVLRNRVNEIGGRKHGAETSIDTLDSKGKEDLIRIAHEAPIPIWRFQLELIALEADRQAFGVMPDAWKQYCAWRDEGKSIEEIADLMGESPDWTRKFFAYQHRRLQYYYTNAFVLRVCINYQPCFEAIKMAWPCVDEQVKPWVELVVYHQETFEEAAKQVIAQQDKPSDPKRMIKAGKNALAELVQRMYQILQDQYPDCSLVPNPD